MIHQIHSQSRAKNRNLGDGLASKCFFQGDEYFLHSAKCKNGDEGRSSLPDCLANGGDEVDHLVLPLPGWVTGGGSSCRLRDEDVDGFKGRLRPSQGPLVVEKKISGEERALLLRLNGKGSCPCNVSGVVEGQL